MPVTKVSSGWDSGNLIFREETLGNGALIGFGVDGDGLDVKFFGDTSGSYMFWDESADKLLLVNSALSVSIAALAVGDSYSGIRSVVNAAAPNNAYGIAGYFESDISGTVAGTVYGFGSWINLASATVCGSNMIAAQDNGIFGPTGLTLTNTKMIIGMRMELVIEGGANPGSLFLFSTNIYDNALTAFYDINAKVEAGWVTGTLSNASGAGHVPLFKEASTGTVHYVNTYTA
jgi:hypothetical protein